ncbi:hypothetical protein DL98DRAFT_538318 [Cadophora sp. DSE1049]|nr:hypothetical protein DL98DRAFT_538318 [Cadophora sp. DSE1049]
MRNLLIATTVAFLGLVTALDKPMGQKDPSLCIAPAEYEACNKDALAMVDNCLNGKKRDTDEYNDCNNSAVDLENANLWSTTHEACSTGEVADPNDKNSSWNCNCCYWSISFLTCPKCCFPYLRYDDERKANLSNFDETWFSCQDTLPTVDCKALGYTYTGEVYLPSNLPLPGTETMSNLAGQVAAPVSGWTYTWSAAGFEQTVTAFSPTGTIINVPASTNVVSSSGSNSDGNASSGTVTDSPTATSSTPTSSATTSTSWGREGWMESWS